jgi:protoporphyrinogen oxidase
MKKRAIIIGAGPAGLTAAYELLQRTDIIPVVLEKSGYIGGISRTMDYKGNRMDMGPHRFFSKSDRVMEWWLHIMPFADDTNTTITYQNKSRAISGTAPAGPASDKVMLVIQRLTRIYFLRKFFAYPIQLSIETLRTLGLAQTLKILFSFLWIRVFPRKPEKSLEDFIINKFGKELYLLFFKDYTEKVWGVPCHEISAEWGAQRIKGVSLSKAVLQAVKSLRNGKQGDVGQKGTETSLIEQFLYPKKGPGALWEEVARQVQEMGGEVYLHQDVQSICQEDGAITSVTTVDQLSGEVRAWQGEYFFSTMPVQELIAALNGQVPEEVKEVAAGLKYRDFINVGVLLKKMTQELKDNWIYIQERDVKVGRLMIYNNWGGGMVRDPETTWIGMEYFCNKTDEFWALDDEAIKELAIGELEQMELARVEDVLDLTVKRMEKTYPAYFGTYDRFEEIRAFTNGFANLFLVGRNGMHKYNNADHSMLTAMVAVDNIVAGVTSKANLWAINTEQEFHEEKQRPDAAVPPVRVTAPETFGQYVFKKHKRWVWTAFALVIGQFFLFKHYYPFANFMYDSYYYVDGAAKNLDINTWPIGYSRFLRIISAFTHSDTILVFIQYLILESAFIYLFFSMKYLVGLSRQVATILFIFFLINPAFLCASNYVLSDALFLALSVIWFTELLWILCKPSTKRVMFQVLLLVTLFTIRYNALYYPLISFTVILLGKMKWPLKLASVGLTVVLLAGFIRFNQEKYRELTGQPQLTSFGGWQLVGNAMIMYRNFTDFSGDKPPAELADLHARVVHHLDSLNHVKNRADTSLQLYWLWYESSPFRKLLVETDKQDPKGSDFKHYASLGNLYGSYAAFLIKRHPLAFARYYLLKNLEWFTVPPKEFLGVYNLGRDSVGKEVSEWFHYKSQKVKGFTKELAVIKIYPILMTLLNVGFILGMVGYLVLKGYEKASPRLQVFLRLAALAWLGNLFFSILASPIMLRYQLFNMVVLSVAVALLAELLINIDRSNAPA